MQDGVTKNCMSEIVTGHMYLHTKSRMRQFVMGLCDGLICDGIIL